MDEWQKINLYSQNLGLPSKLLRNQAANPAAENERDRFQAGLADPQIHFYLADTKGGSRLLYITI
jgi:hypothetical protein